MINYGWVKKWTFDFIANNVGYAAICDIAPLFTCKEWYAPLNGSVHFVLKNQSKSALGLYRGTLKCFIFLRNLCGQPVLIFFSQVEVESGVWKTASILSSRIAGFFYSPRSYMMNVFYLLTQPVAPPRGHHRNGQERCPTDWKNVVMPQILFGRVFIVWYYCRIILLLNWRRRLYFLLTNIVVNNELKVEIYHYL